MVSWNRIKHVHELYGSVEGLSTFVQIVYVILAVNNHWTGLVDWTGGLTNLTTKMKSRYIKLLTLQTTPDYINCQFSLHSKL